jgi:hypothetical protein
VQFSKKIKSVPLFYFQKSGTVGKAYQVSKNRNVVQIEKNGT